MEGLGRHRPVPLGHKDVRGRPLFAPQTSQGAYLTELDGNQLGVSLPRAPSVRVDLPTVSSSGDIGLRLISLDATINVNLPHGSSVEIPFGPLVQSAINALHPTVTNISPSAELGLPDCIDMHDNKYEALRPCSEFGGATRGYVSKSSGPAPVSFSVDFSKTSISMLQGKFRIDFEYSRPNSD
jgi:hypothetical protein